MSKNEVKLKNGKTLVFQEGCFDAFEGTQEELDEFKQELIRLFENPEEIPAEDITALDAVDIPEPQTRQ